MTLIATSINHRFPVMISDILVSDTDVDTSIRLPTNAIDINPYLVDLSAYPVELSQKIYVLRKNICISVAGTVRAIERFLEEFNTYLNYYEEDQINVKAINTFLIKTLCPSTEV